MAETKRSDPYSNMVSVEEWSREAQLPKPLRAAMEALLIETAAYFGREVVYRRELDAGDYIFPREALDRVWRAICGERSESDRLAHGLHALLLYHRLRAGPEWLTIDQFFDAAGPGAWTQNKSAFSAQLRDLCRTADTELGAPPHFVEYDQYARTHRRSPTLPRCLAIGLLYGDLESSFPAL
jgi:hypothetical protein